MIGDIIADNTKKILLEVEVNSISTLTRPSLSWELSYLTKEDSQIPVILKGTLVFETTNSESLLSNTNSEVIVALKIKEASQLDTNIANLITQNKTTEAIAAKESLLKELQDIVHLDTSGTVQKLIQKGQDALSELKQKKDVALAAKTFHHMGYMQDEDDLCGYDEACYDSDEGNYSD